MGQQPHRFLGAAGAILVLALAAGAAAQERVPASSADDAARAAMGQIKPPAGTGGCILLSLPTDVWREALKQAVAGGRYSTPAFQSAVEQATPRCTKRPYARSDAALIGAVVSAVDRWAAALRLTQFGLSQPRLDQAWDSGSAEEKAPFYAAADEFLAPGPTVTPRTLPTSPFATRAGLAADLHQQADPALRLYFLFTAMSERAEAVLAPQAQKAAG